LNALIATRNPIRLTVLPSLQCGTNHALPGHVLQGDVTECVDENAGEVFATITGVGDDRFATLNELAGPFALGTVSDHFRAEVGSVLADMNQRHLMCNDAEVIGNEVAIDPDGNVTVTPP